MKIKTLFLSLILLTPLFFDSIVYAAQEQKKIDLTPEQQDKVNQDLYAAIVKDNFRGVINALKSGADITNTTISSYSYTKIQEAARLCCHPDILKTLFFHGSDPQIQTRPQNESLLHLLIDSMRVTKPHFIEAIKTLLQHKVSLHLIDGKHNNSLHIATTNYQMCITYNMNKKIPLLLHTIKLLLFAGADHEKKNNKNKTALDLIDQEHQAPIERLINIASFFSLLKPLSNLLLPHTQQIPGISTIIVDYLFPHPTEKEQKLWDELAAIRNIQQELLIAPASAG